MIIVTLKSQSRPTLLLISFSTICQQKKVRQAYYQVCRECAEESGVCAKCGKQEEIMQQWVPFFFVELVATWSSKVYTRVPFFSWNLLLHGVAKDTSSLFFMKLVTWSSKGSTRVACRLLLMCSICIAARLCHPYIQSLPTLW